MAAPFTRRGLCRNTPQCAMTQAIARNGPIMNAAKSNPRSHAHAEELLKERLQNILHTEDWMRYRTQVQNLAASLNLDILDCAAALACLAVAERSQAPDPIQTPHARKAVAAPELKMVRYRVELGRKHQITEDSLKKLLVAESGVEHRLIGKIEIHYDHTLIQLPDGMPAEIYHHLKSVFLNRQPLRIKRLDGGSRDHGRGGRNTRGGKHAPAHAAKEQNGRQGKTDATPRRKD